MGMEMDMECDLVEIVQSGVPAGLDIQAKNN